MTLLQRRVLLAGLAGLALSPAWAQADGLGLLEGFLRSTQSGRAQFTQTVTVPPRDGQVGRPRVSSGTFEFQRPQRFRFSYLKPFPQSLVADGNTLWMHDPDLNQVTARKLSQVLQGTPAALVASAADLRGLQADFNLSAQPEAGGLQWVLATPKVQGGTLQSIRVGLRAGATGPELAALDILDSFGQRSVMAFSQFEANVALPANRFEFKPPAGADVIRP